MLLVFVIVWNKYGEEYVFFGVINMLFLCDVLCEMLFFMVVFDFWLLLNGSIFVLRIFVGVEISLIIWYSVVFVLWNGVVINLVELKLFVSECDENRNEIVYIMIVIV